MNLAPDQALIANSDCFVLACALPGSGKSHTLVALTDNLLKKDPDYRVLLITFTNAATQEIKERLHKALGSHRMKRVDVFTFHSLALRMMKMSGMRERLIMGADQHVMIERVLRHGGFSIDHEDAAAYIEEYGRQLNIEPQSGCEGLELYHAYTEMLEHNNCVDFNMVCKAAYAKLAQGEIEPWPVSHILVDEFQDTDIIQYMWLYEHGVRGIKLVPVGDDDQAIYSFRGANGYQNMVNFQKDFNAKAYVLRVCYRCTPEILEAAQRLIEHNVDRVEKPMESGQKGHGKVRVVASENEKECEQAITEIAKAPTEWAVLARTNRHLDEIETYARSHGIAYKRLGGQRLWDQPAAAMFVRMLDAMVNPKSERYLSDVLGFLHEDEHEINQILQATKRRRTSFGDLSSEYTQNWSPATKDYHSLWEQCQQNETNKMEVVSRIAKAMTIVKAARRDAKRDHRIVETVADILTGMKGDLHQRVGALTAQLSNPQKNDAEAKDILTLATLHSAKGLQWQRVWILSSEEGVCPSATAITIADGEKAQAAVEEERRLYYVGMTRAIKELVMSFRYPEVKANANPSRFLYEAMPEMMANIADVLGLERTEEDIEEVA